ncbi:MAG: hypothetical protein ACRD4R_02745 [Candidatus Acidiferrales bacterium]
MGRFSVSTPPEQFVGGTLPQAGSDVEVCENRQFPFVGALDLFVSAFIQALSSLRAASNPPILLPSIQVSGSITRRSQLARQRKRYSSMVLRKTDSQIHPALRDFLDRCVVPALVQKYFAEE